MAKRSLQASQEGAKLARKIFERRGWTQEGMAAELELRTRQPIWRFFTCRPIERYIFIELCTILDLNWWEIAEQVPEPLLSIEHKSEERSIGPKQWVEQIRLKHQDRIDHQCATLRVLGTSRPTPLEQLYVTPHLLGQLASREHLEIAQLDASDSNQLSNLREQRLGSSIASLDSVLQQNPKLRIFGKPGSGKTTLLKWIACQCNQGKFQAELIPVLIKLGNYIITSPETIEFSFLSCLQQELLGSNISDHKIIETLLNEGKFLLLVDELEATCYPQHTNFVLKEIGKFSERYHKNRVIIASRLGQSDFELLQFTDFEIADFDDAQISLLVERWFSIFELSEPLESSAKAESCIDQLKLPQNQRIRELAGVPLFLNRICQIFQGRGNLYRNRIKIYEECFALILEDWSQQGTLGTLTHFQLTGSEQISLLARIATSLLDKGQYYLERDVLDNAIRVAFCELKGVDQQSLSDETIDLICYSFLRRGLLLEQAYGIMSFSHLAFQEYLVFREMIAYPDPQASLTQLLNHLTDARWQEVFLLVSSKWPDQEELIEAIGLAIRSLVSQEPHLAAFLNQLQQKSGQWLLYNQVVETQIALYQLARTPVLFSDLFTYLIDVSVWSQALLFEVTLSKLALWLVVPGWQNTPIDSIQSLLDQTLVIAANKNNLDFTAFLMQFKERLVQHHWEITAVDPWNGYRSELLEMLANAINECCDTKINFLFNGEQVWSLQKYLYVIQLLSDCQAQSKNLYQGKLQTCTEVPQYSDFKQDVFFEFLVPVIP